jgi:hypothetical protein
MTVVSGSYQQDMLLNRRVDPGFKERPNLNVDCCEKAKALAQ